MGVSHFLRGNLAAMWLEKTGDEDAVRAVQRARLDRLLDHAARHVRLHRDRWSGHVPRADDLATLPVLTKAQLMARFDDSVEDGRITLEECARFARDPATVGKLLPGGIVLGVTSGTSGKVGYFVSEISAFEELRGTLFGRILRHRLVDPFDVLRFGPWRHYRIGFVTAVGGHYVTNNLGLHPPPMVRHFYDTSIFDVMTPVPELCRALDDFRPLFFHAYPTMLEVLAREKVAGHLHIEPEVITVGSEPFTSAARRTVTSAWPRADILETYGTTECVSMACQCVAGSLHINEDVCVVESVDESGRAVPEGTLGARVLLTNLVNHLQPLVRYELPDQVMLQPARCPCGSPLRSLRVVGRTDDTFFLRDRSGRYHAHTPIPFETLFLHVEGVAQYQLVHAAQNQLRVTYVRAPSADPAQVRRSLEDAWSQYFARQGLADAVTVGLQETGEIPRDPASHKIRQIVSLVPPPAAP